MRLRKLRLEESGLCNTCPIYHAVFESPTFFSTCANFFWKNFGFGVALTSIDFSQPWLKFEFIRPSVLNHLSFHYQWFLRTVSYISPLVSATSIPNHYNISEFLSIYRQLKLQCRNINVLD